MQQPHGGRFFTSLTSSSVQLPQHTVSCGALHYFFALVKLDFVPTAGVFVTVSGFVGAKGSVGTMMSGQVDLREEIASSLEVTARCSSKHASLLWQTRHDTFLWLPPCGPSVDRHSSVNSGARYA